MLIEEAKKHGLFQSTPPRRRRLDSVRYGLGDDMFQSTPPRRRRLGPGIGLSPRLSFNPRPREGGDPILLPLTS